MIITIDGPVASGKSTIGRLLTYKKDLYYLYSGSLFRALGYLLCMYKGYTAETIAQAASADIDWCLDPHRFMYQYSHTDGEQVFFNGVAISMHLKTPLVDQLSSIIGTNAYAREKLVQLQRTIAQNKKSVVDGRDSGSVVFPTAEYKFYVTASPEVRAQRLYNAYQQKGAQITYAQALQAIEERDARDEGRTVAPLKIPTGAIVVDTSDMSIDEVIDYLIEYIER